MHKVYLHLGSNQGDRLQMLNDSLGQIGEKIGKIQLKSSVYETEPWGLKDQANFLNMAIEVKTKLTVEEVFNISKEIEQTLGSPKQVKWGPRSIDIDILYFDNEIIDTEKLKLPHPQLYNRNFVLIPMMEIAGDYIDPIKNVSIDELYDVCTDTCEVFLYEE